MHLNIVQLQLRHAPQIFFQDGNFDFQLMFVAGVLVVASATAFEVTTVRRNSCRRRFEQLVEPRPRESFLLLDERRFYLFALQHKRHKHGFA